MANTKHSAPTPAAQRKPPPAGTVVIATRLTRRDAIAAAAEARRQGVSRAAWIAAVVRRELAELRDLKQADREAT